MENEVQYGQMNFNLPHDVVPLPSQGLFYANKKKSVKVGYLTAQDENLLANTNKGIMNVINQLLKTKIYEHDFRIDDMLTGDVEAILIFLRNTAFGTKYKLNLVDPKTGNLFEVCGSILEILYFGPNAVFLKKIKMASTSPGNKSSILTSGS